MIGSIIVSYNPDIDLLKENLNSIVKQVDKVLVVDNGSQNIAFIKKIVNEAGSSILQLHSNMGIAVALNSGMSYFQNLHYDWIMTLDQDSIAPKNLIKQLTSVNEFKEKNVGIIAADFIDRTQGETITTRSGVVEYSKRVITSGSLTNVEVWKQVCGFDNQLFIDYVDHDFNQRIINMGFKIYQVSDLQLSHSLGKEISPKSNFLAKIFSRQRKGHAEHSAFRQYYIYRNGIIFIKRYSKRSMYDFLKLTSDIRWIFLFSQPIQQLISALHGVWDGLKYNTDNDLYFQEYLKKRPILKK